MLSVKVLNDEAQILQVIDAIGGLADGWVWAIDILGTPSALLVALLARAGERVRHASGRVVAAMSTAYTGDGKTDAKDAYVIAETAHIRRDLAVVDTDLVRALGVLTGHRSGLVADRVRMINRLRDLVTSAFTALEREFAFASCMGALVLLRGCASPEAIGRIGEASLSRWLGQRRVRGYADVAARAVAAAQHQQTSAFSRQRQLGVGRLTEVSGKCSPGSAVDRRFDRGIGKMLSGVIWGGPFDRGIGKTSGPAAREQKTAPDDMSAGSCFRLVDQFLRMAFAFSQSTTTWANRG